MTTRTSGYWRSAREYGLEKRILRLEQRRHHFRTEKRGRRWNVEETDTYWRVTTVPTWHDAWSKSASSNEGRAYKQPTKSILSRQKRKHEVNELYLIRGVAQEPGLSSRYDMESQAHTYPITI